MKKRTSILPLLLLLLVFLAFLIRRWNEPKRREAFDRNPQQLVYTANALCRMTCRRISKTEIAEIMEKGIINFNLSDRRYQPCPIFTLQGQTAGGELIRVVFEQCRDKTAVLNCYNMKKEFDCSCTGTTNNMNQ
jgi:hypothetical protein